MLGRVRRTTRVDVGLAMSFAGLAYLVWVLVVGVTRGLVNELSKNAYIEKAALHDFPVVTRWLSNAFIHAAPIFDLVGLLWLLVSLVLIVGAGRQRWSISCPWICAICQTMASALLAVWAGLGVQAPEYLITYAPEPPYPTTGWTSLCVTLAIALVIWVMLLIWMLAERARLMRGPNLRDGLRTHIPG